ncbi:MAG: septal ring lytic transglycosylase RlpA family protein [Parvularculaceae bacterium]
MAALASCATVDLPDAPKSVEASGKAPRHWRTGAPYKIDGKWYVPKVDTSYDNTGIASWQWAMRFHGRLTANGEVFDKRRLSAAHKTLPLPTIVEVENLENGRRILVRVNDRGPFVDDRVIDLLACGGRGTGSCRQRAGEGSRRRYRGDAALNELAAAR